MKIYKISFMASCVMLIASDLLAKLPRELDAENRTATRLPSAVVSTHFAKPVKLRVSAWDDEAPSPVMSRLTAQATPFQREILDTVDEGVQRAVMAVQDSFNPDAKVVSSKVRNAANRGMTGRKLVRSINTWRDNFARSLVSYNVTYGMKEGDTRSMILSKASPSFRELFSKCAGKGSDLDSAFLVTRTSKHGHFVGKRFAKKRNRTLGSVSRTLTECFRHEEKRY